MANPVLSSTRHLVENSEHVTIDQSKLEELATQLAGEELEMPDWRLPFYPENDDVDAVDFFILLNTLNFAFTDFESGQKYVVTHGTDWAGSSGNAMALKRALEEGIPLLDGEYLRTISEDKMRYIFRGNIQIPMLKERHAVLREVGQVLCDKYAGHFHHVLFAGAGYLFTDDYEGFVDRLTVDFPSFDDSFEKDRQEFIFNKRAQLAGAMLYARFRGTGLLKDYLEFRDVDELTVFADYQLPKTLRSLGVLIYSDPLAEKVDNQIMILPNSREELEMRAATIHAAKRLQDRINDIRGPEGKQVNALHMDYKLWALGRKLPGHHHLTRTIMY